MNILCILVAALAAGPQTEGPDPEPNVRFVTAPPTAQIVVAVDRAVLVQDIVIEATEPVANVRVAAEPLSGPQIVALQCTVAGNPCDQPFDIAAHGARTIRLSGTIELSGAYSSVVSLSNGETRQSVMLKVTRSTTPFPLELIDPIHAAATSDAQITLEVALQERLGRDATLNPPAVALVRQEEGKSARREAQYQAAIQIDDQNIYQPWVVTRRSAPVLQLKFDQLNESGIYAGRLRLTSPSTPERLDVPISIAVKDCWFTAAALIFVGALLSFGLRLYLKDLRPRLLQQRTTAILISDLERLRNEVTKELGKLEDAEAAVVGALSDRLAKTADQIELGPTPDAADALREIDSKLTLVRRWINARRRVAALTSAPAAIGAMLDAVGAYLTAIGAQGADESLKQIVAAEAAIRAALVEELNKRSESLSAAISVSSLLDVASRDQFLQRLQTANAHAELDARRQALAQIEADIVLSFADALSERIRATAARPRGFESKEAWNTLVDTVAGKLNAVRTAPALRRAAAYRDAYREYLKGVQAALERAVQDVVGLIEAKMKIDKRDSEKRTAFMEDLQKRIRSIGQLVDADKLDDAEKEIRNLNELLDGLGSGETAGFLGAAPDELPTEKAAPAAATPPAAVAAATTAEIDIAGIALRRLRTAGLSPKRITRFIEGLDLIVFGIGLIIATASGVYLLWSGDPTWGSPEDKLVAVLWGLGLQRVSDTVFAGVGGTLQKLSA